jgi:hypothetical protein
MSLELNEKIFNWLVDLKVLKDEQAIKALPNGKLIVNEKATNNFETGHGFVKIID